MDTVVPRQQDQRQWAQTEIKEVLSEHQRTLFYCGGDQAPAQLAQKGYGVSILADSQKVSGHGPRQLVLIILSIEWGGLDQTSRGPFCDSETSTTLRCNEWKLSQLPKALGCCKFFGDWFLYLSSHCSTHNWCN